jgi:hypothetical protein
MGSLLKAWNASMEKRSREHWLLFGLLTWVCGFGFSVVFSVIIGRGPSLGTSALVACGLAAGGVIGGFFRDVFQPSKNPDDYR